MGRSILWGKKEKGDRGSDARGDKSRKGAGAYSLLSGKNNLKDCKLKFIPPMCPCGRGVVAFHPSWLGHSLTTKTEKVVHQKRKGKRVRPPRPPMKVVFLALAAGSTTSNSSPTTEGCTKKKLGLAGPTTSPFMHRKTRRSAKHDQRNRQENHPLSLPKEDHNVEPDRRCRSVGRRRESQQGGPVTRPTEAERPGKETG